MTQTKKSTTTKGATSKNAAGRSTTTKTSDNVDINDVEHVDVYDDGHTEINEEAELTPREKVLKSFEDEYEKYGVGKKEIVFKLKRGGADTFQMLKPKERIVKDGMMFNLRLTKEFDDPVLDNQDKDAQVTLEYPEFISNYISASKNQPAWQKFLIIHPSRGKLYDIEDKQAQSKAALEREEFIDGIKYKIKSADIYMLQAWLSEYTNRDVYKLTEEELKFDLYQKTKRDPDKMHKTITSGDTVKKFAFKKAVKLGYFRVEHSDNSVRWPDSNELVFRFSDSPENGYVSYVNTPKGYDLEKKVAKWVK